MLLWMDLFEVDPRFGQAYFPDVLRADWRDKIAGFSIFSFIESCYDNSLFFILSEIADWECLGVYYCKGGYNCKEIFNSALAWFSEIIDICF